MLYNDSDVNTYPKQININSMEKYNNNTIYIKLKLDKIKQIIDKNKKLTSKTQKLIIDHNEKVLELKMMKKTILSKRNFILKAENV